MAASITDRNDSSSTDDDEALRRCEEAVWDCQAMKTKDTVDNKPASKRLVVADHNHDGNQLQVTQGFQTHVAKKLGAMLDGLISEKKSIIRSCENKEMTENKDEEDEGFRLFSTSVPGSKPEEPLPPKRPVPSSSNSDSEMEMRLKEAAVSISDILPPTALVFLTDSTAPETSSLATKEKVKKKKKKKKKTDPEENVEQDSQPAINNQMNIISQIEDQKVKRKKKKKKKMATLEHSDVLR